MGDNIPLKVVHTFVYASYDNQGDKMKKARPKKERFSYKPLADAMRDARTNEGWSQEQAAEKLGVSQKYYQRIEANMENIHPSLQLLYDLVHLFHISVDEYFFKKRKTTVSSKRRRLDSLIDQMDEAELAYMESNASALLRLRQERKKQDTGAD